MTNIEQIKQKWEKRIEEYNGPVYLMVEEWMSDLKSIEQPKVDIKETIEYGLGYAKGFVEGQKYEKKHLTSKAPKQEVKVDKVVERFKDNGSMYYDNMWK